MTTSDLKELARQGMAAWRHGDAGLARSLFQKIADAGAATPQLWLSLAQTCAALHDEAEQEAALDHAIEAEPHNLTALTMKGSLLAAKGNDRGAASYYQLALANVPAGTQLSPELINRLRAAEQYVAAAGMRFRRHLDAALNGLGNENARFAEALRILTGDQPVYLQQPTSFFTHACRTLASMIVKAFHG